MNFIPFLVLFSLAYHIVIIIAIIIRFNHSNNNNRSVTSSAFVRLIPKVLWLFKMAYTDTPYHTTCEIKVVNYTWNQEKSKIHRNITHQGGNNIKFTKFCWFYQTISTWMNLAEFVDLQFWEWIPRIAQSCSKFWKCTQRMHQIEFDIVLGYSWRIYTRRRNQLKWI